MKKFITTVLLFTACNAYAICSPQEASWRVRVPNGYSTSYGSATAIGPQILVTAGHMVDFHAGVAVVVTRPDGTVYKGHSIAVSSDPNDMAVIALDNASLGENYVLLGKSPALGQTVREFGYGHLGILRTGEGTVNRQYGTNEFESGIAIESGDSGCGVFDADGKLVGVNTACEGSARTADGQAHTGASISTGIDNISRYSNIDTNCPGGVCQRPFLSPQINIGNRVAPINPMTPVSPGPIATVPPSPVQPLVPVPSPVPSAPGLSTTQIMQIVQDFDNRVKKLENAVPVTAPAGPVGPQGPAGPAGVTPDVAAAVAQALANLKLPVQVLDQNGQVIQSESIALNGQHALKLQLVPITK